MRVKLVTWLETLMRGHIKPLIKKHNSVDYFPGRKRGHFSTLTIENYSHPKNILTRLLEYLPNPSCLEYLPHQAVSVLPTHFL